MVLVELLRRLSVELLRRRLVLLVGKFLVISIPLTLPFKNKNKNINLDRKALVSTGRCFAPQIEYTIGNL